MCAHTQSIRVLLDARRALLPHFLLIIHTLFGTHDVAYSVLTAVKLLQAKIHRQEAEHICIYLVVVSREGDIKLSLKKKKSSNPTYAKERSFSERKLSLLRIVKRTNKVKEPYVVN